MTNQGVNFYKSLLFSTLLNIGYSKLNKMNLWCEIMLSFLTISGRINFLQLGRYGKSCERRYRSFFEKSFDFLSFNIQLTNDFGSGNYAIALDPSYISKSGKHTPGLGYFWSGCAGKAKWGLEVVGFAAIDMTNHTAFHLEAAQTICQKDSDLKLTDLYLAMLKERVEKFKKLSPYLVADAWFSKRPFVEGVTEMNMHLISRFRDDANLKYLYVGEKRKGRGRPNKYDGKVDPKMLNMKYFKEVYKNEDSHVHSAVLYSVALKREILLIHAKFGLSKNKQVCKLYFSTDLKMDPKLAMDIYSARFQIEFVYRDAKQYTGLNHCQARSQNKLNFHFNMSLSAVNIAKIKHYLTLPKELRKTFSMHDVKVLNNNALMLDVFLDEFGINPNTKKNRQKIMKLRLWGVKAA